MVLIEGYRDAKDRNMGAIFMKLGRAPTTQTIDLMLEVVLLKFFIIHLSLFLIVERWFFA